MKSLLLAAALSAAGPAAAGPANAWVQRSSSLLHYDSSGTISTELPLGRWEEPAGARMIPHETSGGVSRNGGFAWTWEKAGEGGLVRYFGPSGRMLWSESGAVAIESGEPLTLSANGELALLCKRSAAGVKVAVKSYIGNTLWEVGPFPILHSVELTDNGRYALLRWTEPDMAATHTFLELASKTRKDVPSADLHLGQAVIDENGAVRSGKRGVFSFPLPAKNP